MKRYAPTLYLLLVFGGGLASGVFGDRMYEQRTVLARPPRPTPEEWKKRHLDELQGRLHLTPDQSSRISAVLDETHAEMLALMARSEPDMERIQKEQYDKVQAVLTPEQVVEYAKFHAEREKRRLQNRPQ